MARIRRLNKLAICEAGGRPPRRRRNQAGVSSQYASPGDIEPDGTKSWMCRQDMAGVRRQCFYLPLLPRPPALRLFQISCWAAVASLSLHVMPDHALLRPTTKPWKLCACIAPRLVPAPINSVTRRDVQYVRFAPCATNLARRNIARRAKTGLPRSPKPAADFCEVGFRNHGH